MKNARKFLILFLTVAFIFLLGSCGPEPCAEHKDEDTDGKCDVCGGEVEPPEEGGDEEEIFDIVKDSEASFNIVISNSASGSTNLMVDKLVKLLSELGVETKKVTEDKEASTDFEVLIGDVKERGAEYDIDEHTLGLKGYEIRLIGNKLVIVGGTDEALSEAVEIFKSDILGIKKDTESITDVTVSEEDNVIKVQDNYRILGLSVEGAELNTFFIKVDTSNKELNSTAKSLQTALYTAKGYWLDIYDAKDAPSGKCIEIKVSDAGGKDGFIVHVVDGNLLIETEFPNKILGAVEKFVSKNISTVVGKAVDFGKKFSYTDELRYVYYSEFGAVGDGVTDDFAALYDTHVYANKYGHTVKGDSGKTYYIGFTNIRGNKALSIPVKTDVEWGTSKFFIDDKVINATREHQEMRTSYIFTVASSFDNWKTTYTAKDETIASIVNGFKAAETTNIGFAPGYKALLVVIDDNNYAYNRWGTHATENPPYQREVTVVDAEGNIIENNEFLLDFTGVTKVEVYRADDEPITLIGGEFTTNANEAPPVYTSYSRGILFNRSNATIKNTVHKIINEPVQAWNDLENGPKTGSAPYSAFFCWVYSNNTTLDSIVPQGHKTYQDFEYDENGKAVKIHSQMGTYDIGGNHACGAYLKNCKQSNFFKDEATKTPWLESDYWGIMGSNHTKNITFDGCRLTRFDAHAGVYNVNIKNTEIVFIKLTGGGVANIENTTVYEPTNTSNYFLELREDYGSTWNGTINIKDCNYFNYVNPNHVTAKEVTLISAQWNNWDFGNYKTHLPDVNIDNLFIRETSDKMYIFRNLNSNSPNDTFDADRVYTKDGSDDTMTPDKDNKYENKNPMRINSKIVIRNNENGYEFIACPSEYVSRKMQLIYED